MATTDLQMQWSLETIAKHNYPLDAWVILDGKVYDVTTFISTHPGGAKVMAPYLGKDISNVYRGVPMEGIKTAMHKHDDSSISLIQRDWLGYVEGAPQTKAFTTPSSCIDTDKPVLAQLGKLGKKYYDCIDSPLHLKESARIFPHTFFGNILEWMSRTNWYLVPSVWCPVILLLLGLALTTPLNADYQETGEAPVYAKMGTLALCFAWGVFSWTLLEWILHRWMFHCEHWLWHDFFSSSAFIQVHFVMHGVHHLFPSDAYRLVMPPWNACVIAAPLWLMWSLLLPTTILYTFFSGLAAGYISYDMMHYFLHFGGTKWTYLQSLRTHHMVHHYTNVDEGYGVSSKLWDYALGDLGVRIGNPTAKFGRWAVKGSKPSDESSLFPYHLFIGIVVWFIVPMVVGKIGYQHAAAELV